MAAENLSPTGFYTEVLGAELRNARWSWGAYDPLKSRLYLRVWEDEIVRNDGNSFVMVLRDVGQSSPGRRERERHLELAAAGAEVYGVLCTPDRPRQTGLPRKILDFDRQTLLRFGQVIDFPAGRYAEIIERVPVSEVKRPASDAAMLHSDLKAIQRQKGLTTTEREALISARIGQGGFRTAVLALWGRCCAVTGCGVTEAIRASHIKPWRFSTNEERLDPMNGLPLVATLDALFDAGMISFADQGHMLVAQRLAIKERQRLGLDLARIRRRPSEATAAYLAEHRARFGFGDL